VTTVLGAADPDIFRPHERGSGVVGMVSAYYPRKSPERLISLVRAMPDTPFLLVGRGWRESASSDDLVDLHNLEIVEAPYSDYPSYYTKMDVFVSVSSLEGGPIPLIEAMMSNAVPVVTRTGFAPDIVTNGINGFLCDVDVSTTDLVGLVREGLRFGGEIHHTVHHLDWERYARFLSRELEGAT
jgi:glycosyltransferase involved in cell wall biosynthesis